MTCPVCYGPDCEVSWCNAMNGARPAPTDTTTAGMCQWCGQSHGKHGSLCRDLPKRGNKMCIGCFWYNGKHSSVCRTRGYGAVGHHPDSPDAAGPPTERAPARRPCPCGIDRRDCEYHR